MTRSKDPMGTYASEQAALYGADVLTDPECLAMAASLSVKEAREVLALTGQGIAGLAKGLIGMGMLQQISGIGAARARRIIGTVALARRLSQIRTETGADIKPCICDALSAYAWFSKPGLLDWPQCIEKFCVMCLDTRHHVLSCQIVHVGTGDHVEARPREVFGMAIRERASSILVGHLHPSGDPEPSEEDRALTRHLSEAGRLLGITLLDHIIVGEGRFVSLAERGMV